MLFPVERCGFCGVEPASHSICRIVKPEPNVKSMRRLQTCSRIEPKDLIQQNRFDCNFRFSFAVNLDVSLVPGQAEVSETGIYFTVRQQVEF